ncbi:alpha-amylase family glycosyl hydrolase [soil metagenome]
MTPEPTAPWWKWGVIYQVYPRSFQDTNGDGIGDLAGVLRRLDHLVALGVDAMWLSPIFPSPMADFGYDVADYCGVDPQFGSLSDADAVIAAAHERGIKLILDFVPNHSSDQHPWFKASRSSRTNPKRDWYIWKDAKPDGSPPNNWQSDFGGSSWEWDEPTGQYYLHAFLKEQPDLNWRNPDVVAAMLDVLRFWFDRGVDGFRIDVLWHIVKSADFADNPPKPGHVRRMGEMFDQLQVNNTSQPKAHELAARMRAVADGYPGDRVLIGEIYLPVAELVAWYGSPDRPQVQPFNFQLINAPWKADAIRTLIADYEAALPPGAWPNWVLGNHDRPRIASRVGEAQARVAAMLLLTLRGTPTIYYGDEIGLPDTPIPSELTKDPAELRQPGEGVGRDPVRTPMPWSDAPTAGFTTGEPWLPLNADWPVRNVETQAALTDSPLALHRALLKLRRERPSLALGDLKLIDAWGSVLAYERRLGDERTLIALNLSDRAQTLGLPPWAHGAETLACTLPGLCKVSDGVLHLRPDEGVVVA